jgi:tRNA(fMet)-specific endonuclease VapC
MILLDTDHFTVVTDARHALHTALVERLQASGDLCAIPIVSVEEQLRAWLAHVRRYSDVAKQVFPYDRLVRLLDTVASWDIARWSQPAAEEFKRLRKERVRIGTQDLKIAAIAITTDSLLLSANLRDFEQVPGIRVEDWLYLRGKF